MYHRIPITFFLAVLSTVAAAETVYRSVDAQGNVTFTDSPPAASGRVEEITIDVQQPPPDRVRQSQREAQKDINRARRLQKQRDAAEAEHEQEVREAEKALEQARKTLEEAKVVGPGDRRGKADGGTRLTLEYLNRVKAAEKGVEEARKRLNALQ
ncbi:MAG: DUF4124 domain-containing protein [Gammaproteobacteria bacterium]|jgi:hypothetical protein